MRSPRLIWACLATLLLLLLTTVQEATSLPAARLRHNRLSFPGKPWKLDTEDTIAMATAARSSVGANTAPRERRLVSRGLVHKGDPLPTSSRLFHRAAQPRRRIRSRRHALIGSRRHVHGQLMRVGCVLGTCQVQTLSYRLYHLIGQSGKEQTSPVNPRSPHSYG